MINKIGVQVSPQSQIKFKGQNDQQPQQGEMYPLHKYVERNQIINLTGATVIGTMFGLLDSKIELAQKDANIKFKDIFKGDNFGGTIKKVGGKILALAGLLYASDLLFQKMFKNNKEYEESYQESLKTQKQ